MKKTILLLLVSTYSFHGLAQEIFKNSLSTSLVRLEKNSQTMYGKYYLKFVTGIEYQKHIDKWSFGIKFEHGLNKFEEYPTNCYDCFYGAGYLKEDNVYLTANYSVVSLFKSRLSVNAGIGLYYSHLNYSANFQGGISGSGTRKNSTFNTVGLAPGIAIIYFPIPRLFVSLNSNFRYGLSIEYDDSFKQFRNVYEFVLTAPELKIGVKF